MRKKFRLFDILQKRRRCAQETLLKRVLDWEFQPHDLVTEGEAYYTKLCQQQNSLVECQVARLMGDYCFLVDGIPAQTLAGFESISKSGISGQWYSLGDDVNALFFKPSGDASVSASSPKEGIKNYVSYLEKNNQYLHPVFSELGSIFGELLEERKSALTPSGSWFNCPDESSADGFLRRLSKDDPCYSVYETYCKDLKQKWSKENENLKQLSAEEAKKKMGEIEKVYLENVKVWEGVLADSGASDGGTAAEGIARKEAVEAAASNPDTIPEGVKSVVAFGVAKFEKGA